MSCKVYPGNCRDVLKALQMESIDFATTFTLYWNLRDHRTEPLIWAMGVADPKKEKNRDYFCDFYLKPLQIARDLEDAIRNV